MHRNSFADRDGPSWGVKGLDRSQSLFYFVPQEKRLRWRAPWAWKNMGDLIFHPENLNIWPTTGQNWWWYMLRSSLVFTCFNFIHYWGQGGPFSPGDLSISSQMSWGTTMWIWADQSQRSMFFKAENCSYVSSAMICRSKTSIVHYCIIFFCSLDVRNIVQGGDPLYAVVNHKEGCGGHNLPKWVRFFLQKNTCI